MSKEKIKDIIKLLIFAIGCIFLGYHNVFAITFTDFTDVHSNTTLYVGYADSGNPISWPYNNSTLYQRNIISLDYVVNTNITGGVHYEFESHMLGNFIINNPIYSVVDANGNTCLTDSYYMNFINGEYPRWDFQCSNNSTGFTIHIQQSNSSKLFNDGYMGWGSAILSKTNTPISSTGNDTEEIINNNNYNTNLIIDNQNQNTLEILESQKVCKSIGKQQATYNGYLDSSGILHSSQYTSTTDYITIHDSDKLFLVEKSSEGNPRLCFFNSSKSIISCILQNDTSLNSEITMPQNSKYIRMTIQNNTSLPQYKLCSNGNQGITNSIDDLKDSLTDDSPTDVSGLADTLGWLPAGPIDSIINLPLNLFNNLVLALNGTCEPLTVPLPYVNKNMSIPCLSTLISQMGFTTFWNWVGTIASIIILYRYLLNLYQYYDDLTTLKANFISDFGGAP